MAKRSAAAVTTESYEAAIAEAAYFKAEQRGFSPGYEVQDWLDAERELATEVVSKPKRRATKVKTLSANGRKPNASSR